MAPIPRPLGRALIDAMGGWGPYTVHEIANLFDDFEFNETVEVEPEQGVRRTTAAEYLEPIDWDDAEQRRRLLSLVDEVLVNYPIRPTWRLQHGPQDDHRFRSHRPRDQRA